MTVIVFLLVVQIMVRLPDADLRASLYNKHPVVILHPEQNLSWQSAGKIVSNPDLSSLATGGSCPEDLSPNQLAIIIVDHGSRLEVSNQSLLSVVEMFQADSSYEIVEPAHMEIAEPTIAMALDRCVEQGARFVVVHPYFLASGKHWQHDIPRLVAEAADQHPGIGYVVSEPLGPHRTMSHIMKERIEQAISSVPRSSN
ncbi:MAG: CbiX/SirB N-terminal domain-containing protein [Pirellulaceae bacterium]|jgi:hypothetical protein